MFCNAHGTDRESPSPSPSPKKLHKNNYLGGAKDPVIDLKKYLKAYFHEGNSKARKLTNAILALLEVFVNPAFRNVYDLKLMYNEQKKRFVDFCDDVKDDIKQRLTI